jgi:cellobiose phosphorylase
VAEWVLGVRPDWDGLIIDPCLPPSWKRARMTRPFRGAVYDISIERGGEANVPMTLPVAAKGERVEVTVRI